MIKPKHLQKGDKIATISLSWGGAGDLLYRYNIAKERISQLGFEIVEMEHTLKGGKFIYDNPKKRAQDLMNAFKDPTIKAIIACIGGDDSTRILPYINFETITNNPKIFVGFSDSTTTHFICQQAGITSFYGPSVLTDFGQNVEMFDYTINWFEKALCQTEPIGEIANSDVWTSQFLDWFNPDNQTTNRKLEPHNGYELLQGTGIARGHLIGGCLESLENLKGTTLWNRDKWKDAIIFFETCETKTPPDLLIHWLRNYATQGILQNAKGIIWGKPYDNLYYEEYKTIIEKVIKHEEKLDIPILYNMNFGHTSPIITIPYGVEAEINCEKKTFSILESGVQ